MDIKQQSLFKQRKIVQQQDELVEYRIQNGLCPKCGKVGIYEKNLAGTYVKLCEDHF